MKAKILWVEGHRGGSPAFIPKLKQKGYSVEIVSTGKEAVSRVPEYDPDLVVVDAASLRTSGSRICQSLRDGTNGLPILLIANPDRDVSKNVCANVVLKRPFTIRKLVNRIEPLLPGGGDRIWQVGAIQLDLERRKVQCENREAHLTPRLSRLLIMLMQHPGEVMEREKLFRKVWKTEYIGDTRTLDVHISWLRRAIEDNPRRPKFIKTIRGVGYRLDV